MQCKINKCFLPVFVKKHNLCRRHYLRFWRYGNPTAGTYYVHHGMVKTPIHNAWSNIKARTTNPKSQYFHCYGGRGIKMHQPWFENFMEFYNYIIKNIGEKPSKNHSIDRIDNDKNYEPNNIRWATPQQQARNHRYVKNSSGYRGVSWKKKNKKWQAAIRLNGKSLYLGLFISPLDAFEAYKQAAYKYYKETI